MKKNIISSLLFLIVLINFKCNWLNAQQKKDSLWYYYSLFSKANNSSELIRAYKFYSRKKESNLANGDIVNAVQNLRYIASIQKRIGHLNESEVSAVQAIELLNELKLNSKVVDEARIGLYNHLGNIYTNTKNFNKAIDFYNRSLKITHNPNQINIILNNKAFIYQEQKKYNKANVEFKRVYINSLKTKNKKQIARALSNLGFVRSKLKYPDAILNLEEALKIRKSISYLPGMFSSYIYLSEHYRDNKNRKKAQLYADKALEIANRLNNIKYKFEALSYLAALSENLKIVEYKKLQDSITLSNQLKENKFAAYKYDYTQAILKAKESELKSEKEKSKRILSQSIVIVTIISSLAIFYIVKERHRKDKIKQVYNVEARISRKVHDEVANDLYHVMNKIQNLPNSNKLLNDLDNIYNKTRDISKENGALEVNNNFKNTLNDLVLSYNNKDVNIITKNIFTINWSDFSETKKIIIYRVIQELMTNMKKHSKASLVSLSFKQSGKTLAILYSDNGIGSVIKKGNGLLNMENRIKSINGKITFDARTQKGFKVIIKI